ncbi:hypothetical protein GCM10015535_01440 [Streptomyces gelaticus]|uniref:Uncharacterized protein n=1 Tax=Streptomyces gelaticus TaxID=285446 RepID=A0ABQ2VQ92_9ACTN|nr:hypothetical protein [Streptomyces gelaticus]GGV73794.1 hypothetical protein GCM10015535_01440 [Streptomyces gelaticus]
MTATGAVRAVRVVPAEPRRSVPLGGPCRADTRPGRRGSGAALPASRPAADPVAAGSLPEDVVDRPVLSMAVHAVRIIAREAGCSEACGAGQVPGRAGPGRRSAPVSRGRARGR